MLPMSSSAMPCSSSFNFVSRTCSTRCCASEVSAVIESNMNCRFSSSSAVERMDEFFKFRLKIVHGVAGIFLRGGVKFHVLRRLGKIRHFGRVTLVVLGGFFALIQVVFRHFFENGVLLKFGRDERLKLERRRLKQGERLLKLRRKHQRLRQPLRKL